RRCPPAPRSPHDQEASPSSVPVTSDTGHGTLDFDAIARELVVALLGRRQPAVVSAQLGYRSNVVSRWCAGSRSPGSVESLLYVQDCHRPGQVIGRGSAKQIRRSRQTAPGPIGGSGRDSWIGQGDPDGAFASSS